MPGSGRGGPRGLTVTACQRSSRSSPGAACSPRDETLPPALPLVGRFERAQANFFETFPILVAAILLLTALGLSTPRTALGAWLWLGGRIVYLPLYALGVPIVRSLAWAVSVVGIVMILWPALAASFH